MHILKLFSLFQIDVTIDRSGLISSLIVWPIFSFIASRFQPLSLGEAIIAGLLSVLVVMGFELVHQGGHAFIAWRVGYPMQRIHFGSILALGLYPKDEPTLPTHIHVKRALGGFWVNLVLGLLMLPLAQVAWAQGGVWGWLMGFTTFMNIAFFGLGAFLPIDSRIGTTDGGTLLRLWRERNTP
jgi:peptidoglycan/LPS O-acetylase OafA/YrhL